MRRKFKLKHLVRLIAMMLSLLTICGCIAIFIVVKVAIDEGVGGFNCLNYCMDALYEFNLSGVVIDKNTREPVVGASVIIADSETQYCPPCEPSETFHLQTDEKGHFRLPHGERDRHRLTIYIEADNCDSYTKEYHAFELEGPEGMVGEGFELTCLPSTQSLFETDTCSPPCWFGLIPGMTAASEVFSILESLQDVTDIKIVEDSQIHPIDGYVEDGFYTFRFMYAGMGGARSYIRIDNQIFNLISISVQNDIFLSDVLLKLGNPDKVMVASYVSLVTMVSFYDDENLIIIFHADGNVCKIADMQNQLYVETLYYYDEDFRDRLISSEALKEPLFTHLSNDILQLWLQTDDDIMCDDAITPLFDAQE